MCALSTLMAAFWPLRLTKERTLDFPDILLHLLGFALPGFFVGFFMVFAMPMVWPRRPSVISMPVQLALHTVLTLTVSLAGLWWFGRDGKVATYGAVVLMAATAQWAFSGAWRK